MNMAVCWQCTCGFVNCVVSQTFVLRYLVC